MTAPKWWEGRLAGWDTESTGVNVHTDRIVTASLVHVQPGQRPRAIEWIIDPGIDIPVEASNVHGWTRDRILAAVGAPGQAVRRTNGGTNEMVLTADAALYEIAGHLGTLIHTETPIVAANAAYDFSLFDAECRRNQVDTLTGRPDGVRGVVDPMILAKQWDPYRKTCWRKGPDYPSADPAEPGVIRADICDREAGVHYCGGCRGGKHRCGGCGATDSTLTGLCAHYGVVLAGAHSSSADAIAAVRLAVKLAQLWPDTGRLKLSTLFTKQREWRYDQQEGPKGLKAWFEKNGEHEKAAEVCGEWPLHMACAPATVGAVA